MQEGRAALRKGSQIRGAQEGTKWSGGARLVTRRDTPQAQECWTASQEVPPAGLEGGLPHLQQKVWECQRRTPGPLYCTPSCGGNPAGHGCPHRGESPAGPWGWSCSCPGHTVGTEPGSHALPSQEEHAGLPCQQRARRGQVCWTRPLTEGRTSFSIQLPQSLSGLAQGGQRVVPEGRPWPGTATV